MLLSSLRAHQESYTGQNPSGDWDFFAFHLQIGGEDESWSTLAGDVDWALVNGISDAVSASDGSHVHDRALRMQDLWLHIHEISLLISTGNFPGGSLEEETSDVGSNLGCLEVLFGERVLDVSLEADVIEWQLMGARCDLHNGSQE